MNDTEFFGKRKTYHLVFLSLRCFFRIESKVYVKTCQAHLCRQVISKIEKEAPLTKSPRRNGFPLKKDKVYV